MRTLQITVALVEHHVARVVWPLIPRHIKVALWERHMARPKSFKFN